MAGKFEVFLDSESKFRFRLLGPDGAVMAVSQAFGDKPALVAGIAAIRECAGTGLVTDMCAMGAQPAAQVATAGTAATEQGATEQGVDERPADRLHVFAAAKGMRHHVAPAHWERRRDHAGLAN